MENNFNEIAKQDKLVALAADRQTPEPYRGWIAARAVAMSSALLNGAGNLLQADKIATFFREAIGLDEYAILKSENELHAYDALIPYRGGKRVTDLAARYNLFQIANAPYYNKLGKDILHPRAVDVDCYEELPLYLAGTSIPVLPGAFCKNEAEVAHVVAMFEEAGKPYIIKDAFGTDGSNLVHKIDSYQGGSVVVELAVDYLTSLSVQYLHGNLGYLTENPKDKQNRWLGNTMNYGSNFSAIGERVLSDAQEFVRFLYELTGDIPTIFGMDFLVFENNGKIEYAFIDPNLRMPGNLFMYYQKAVIETCTNLEVAAMRSQLIYAGAKKLDAVTLQRKMQHAGIGLVNETGNGYELLARSHTPVGIYPIIQDEGKLSMINIFGRDEAEVDDLLEKFYRI